MLFLETLFVSAYDFLIKLGFLQLHSVKALTISLVGLSFQGDWAVAILPGLDLLDIERIFY